MKKTMTWLLIGLLITSVSGTQVLALSPAQQTHTVTLTSDHEVSVGYNSRLNQKVAYDSTQDAMRFGNYMAPTPRPGDAHFLSYLHFDLGAIPGGAVIQGATLSVFVHDQRFPSRSLNAGAYNVTSGWTEAGLSNTANWDWATLPGTSSSPEATNNISGLDQWVTWDVTSLCQAWHGGSTTNHGVMLAEFPRGTARQGFGARSRAGAVPQNAPRLVVTYVGAAPAKPTPRPVEIRPVITKWALPQQVSPGEQVTYTIQTTNVGRDAPIDVVVTDIVSEHMEVITATTTQGTVDIAGQTVMASVGVIGQNFVVEVEIVARVRDDAPAPLEIENYATFNSPNGGNHRSQPVIVSVSGPGSGSAALLPVTGWTDVHWGILLVVAIGIAAVIAELRHQKQAL